MNQIYLEHFKKIVDPTDISDKVKFSIDAGNGVLGAIIEDLSDNFKSNKELNPYIKNLPDSISNLLSNRYEEIFKLFYKHRDKIERVTFWGLSDKYSWKNDWPAKGRTNYPLLFDRNLSPKKAYRSDVNWRKNIN